MRHPFLRAAASRAGWAVARLVATLARTWRVEVDGSERLAEARRSGGVLYCFWHGRMLELAAAHAGQGVGVLVSSHPDGVLAARIIEPLGYIPIRGSRRRNPIAGFRAMLRYAAAGGDLALTPDAHSDGHRVLPGAVALARLTGHALLPVAAAAAPRRRVESWDRFEIPWPGARIRIRYGPPVLVPPRGGKAAGEVARRELETSLTRLHAELERELAGRPQAAHRPTVPLPG